MGELQGQGEVLGLHCFDANPESAVAGEVPEMMSRCRPGMAALRSVPALLRVCAVVVSTNFPSREDSGKILTFCGGIDNESPESPCAGLIALPRCGFRGMLPGKGGPRIASVIWAIVLRRAPSL